ncbi:MAG: hemolysin III family protein, partial [Spirochaetales bacterium]|nr:hemolysin III family protein [Spirochaetales bacterium]
MRDENKEKKLPQFSKDGSIHVTDEVINTVTHMAGAIFSLLGTVLLIVLSAEQGKVWHIVSFSIYGFSLIFLFL